MKAIVQPDTSLDALGYGFLMTAAYILSFIFKSPLMLAIMQSLAFLCGCGMVRATWHAKARLIPILWLIAYSVFGFIDSLALGYANFGPEMTERKIRGLQTVYIVQYFGLLGGAILFILSLLLCFRGFFPNKP